MQADRPRVSQKQYPWRDASWVQERGLEGVLLADGFDEALIGFGTHFNTAVAVYDWHKCVAILEQDAIDACTDQDECDHYGEAVEFMDHNTTGAWVGPGTPVFLRFVVDAELLQDARYGAAAAEPQP